MSEDSGSYDVAKKNVTENLMRKKEIYKKGLSEVNKALDALSANPEIERVLNLVIKAGRF